MSFQPDPALIARLSHGELSFAVVQDGKVVHECMGRGIAPALDALDRLPELLAGAEVYDTIVGKAAAALFILGGVRAVYAETISDSAVALLERAGVECRWGVRTGQIVNRTGDGLCPFEQAVLGCAEPADCLPVIRETLARLRTAN